jgi:hypothetical protein
VTVSDETASSARAAVAWSSTSQPLTRTSTSAASTIHHAVDLSAALWCAEPGAPCPQKEPISWSWHGSMTAFVPSRTQFILLLGDLTARGMLLIGQAEIDCGRHLISPSGPGSVPPRKDGSADHDCAQADQLSDPQPTAAAPINRICTDAEAIGTQTLREKSPG